MVTELLVDNYIEDGTKLLASLKADGVDVTAAFWAKTREDGNWTLYIASRMVDVGPLAAGYRKVYKVLRNLPSPWISESDIKLIGSNNPIAKDVVKLQSHWSGRTIIRKKDFQIGSMFVEELIIYPA